MTNNSTKLYPSFSDDQPNDLSFLDSVGVISGENMQEVEGKLAVDVLQTKDELVVVAPMAGTPPDKIELHLHNDLLTIRGERQSPASGEAEYFYEECYWGRFSRTIVLPVDVKVELVEAKYKNGTLIIRLPKALPQSDISLVVVEE